MRLTITAILFIAVLFACDNGDSTEKRNNASTDAEEPGGNHPDPGGNNPDPGGNNPDPGGNNPDPGGNNPDPGGNNPDPGGSIPDPGGNNPDPGGSIPDPGGNNPDPGGNNPDPGGSNPEFKPCAAYKLGESLKLSKKDSPDFTEISGIAYSRVNPKILYAHNDSGDETRFFAVDENFRKLAEWKVSGVSDAMKKNMDWEDIAVGPCGADSDKSCIYIGDIGNNSHKRTDLAILIFEEPSKEKLGSLLAKDAQVLVEKIEPKRILSFSYPEELITGKKGKIPDAESLMVHPKSAEIFLVTKSKKERSYLVRIPREDNAVAEKLGEKLYGEDSGIDQITMLGRATVGADFAPNASAFAVRTYAKIYVYDMTGTESVAEAFAEAPVVIDSQGGIQVESVAFESDSVSLRTMPEFADYKFIKEEEVYFTRFVCERFK